MLSLYLTMFLFRQKSWWVLKLSLQPFWKRSSTWGQCRSVCVIRGDQLEQQNWWFMVRELGHMMKLSQLSTGLQTYTDLCLFYSAVQCTVLPARSYREMDMHFSTVAVRMLESGGVLILLYIVVDIIWSLKTQSSSMEVSHVLVHFSFLAKLHRLSLSLSKKKVWFHNDLCSQNEMRQRDGNKNSRAEVESVPSSERVTKPSKFLFFFFKWFLL